MSRRVARLLAGSVALASGYARGWRRANLRLLVSEQLHQRHIVPTRYGSLVFLSTDVHALEAPREFAGREPETLAWIDGFAAGAVFWDIGANLGAYSLYAGKRGDIDVLAFEPSPPSFAALCANIAANRLDRVRAYCLAIAESTGFGTLNMPFGYPGSVYNAFEQTASGAGRSAPVERRQAALGIAADDLVARFDAPAPHHIKIDVDGSEPAILRGAGQILSAPTLVSVLVEHATGDTEQNRAIDALLAAAGFCRAATGKAGGPDAINVIYRR